MYLNRKFLLSVVFVILAIQCFSQLSVYLPTSTTGQIIEHQYFTLSYSEKHEQAEWVAYELTKAEVAGVITRTNDFRPDPLVKTQSAQLSDYKESGYDRGHLAPAADMKMSHTAMSESFYLSNMSPQSASFNRGIWSKLEKQVRTWAVENESIYVVTGPVFADFLGEIGASGVSVPGYYYKVILDYTPPEVKAIALVLPNEKGAKTLSEYVVSIDFVESLTGIDFYPQLPDDEEQKLEASKDYSKWSFVPTGTRSHKGADVRGSGAANSIAQQCKGTASSTGVRCKSTTKNSSGYCHNHVGQAGNNATAQPANGSASVRCAGITQAGKRCKRMTTSSNGRCYQHP
ncbi:MAG TPA: DNA/RNA non-specific endonuclease [Flavobacteriales bacterium]|nr:DNA/RNA non-specific endonuclease [Flavobacteriales bacterium]